MLHVDEFISICCYLNLTLIVKGKEAAECFNFQAALFKYKNGIEFLTERLWLEDSTNQLCRELHEGAAFASFALGESADVELYARAIIEQVPLEDSIAAHAYYIRSLNKAGRFTEALATGLVLLRRLSIDIPFAPSPMTMMDEMTKTGQFCQYTSEQIINLKQKSIDGRTKNILSIYVAVMAACHTTESPYAIFVTCSMMKYSFQNGVFEESAGER